MKRIEAVIPPDTVLDVCSALDGIGQLTMTLSGVEGRGGREWTHSVRCATYHDSTRERSRLEIVSPDADTDRIVRAIREAVAGRGAGEGTIFVHDLADVIRIG